MHPWDVFVTLASSLLVIAGRAGNWDILLLWS
jgi:hypothetical protein